ncbi:MAG: DUF3048 domain-containing protein [Lachnospiraceae bacterium]|nr:DUF3048 domain-containing protein [Lachnospiraceae bacterium]MBP5413874.1 DUF3048 domain-containing protein [Lachnospiraceae bacterium]MBP5744748.1 DUF3048 domain-containing protein [Lachnospiraceae bacterium]
MSKRIGILAVLVLTMTLTACKTPKEAAEDTQNIQETQTPQIVETETDPAAEVVDEDIVSYFTGLPCTKEQQQHRPLAVMLNNIKEGCPQSGTSEASIIYECPVEGRITRLMGIFEDYEHVEKIGSIRSCRDYFVFLANEYDCIYCHFGQATPYVGDYLNSDGVDNISGAVSGIERPATNTFYRVSERKAPHNVYINTQGLLEDIEKFGYRTTLREGYTPKFTYLKDGDNAYSNDPSATVLYPGGKETGKANGFSTVQSRFEYNAEDGKYYRFQYGSEHIDEVTGQQLKFDNVIFQYCHGEVRDVHDYLAFGCHGDNGYKVQVFTQGKMKEGTWKRTEDTLPATYTDYDGNPIPLTPGKTWVCIIWNDYADDVVIE